jgi:hypothetical protein
MTYSKHAAARTVAGLFLCMIIVAISFERGMASGDCDKLTVDQNGRELKPIRGVFRLEKKDFVLRYNGKEKNPSFTVSVTPALNNSLKKYQRDLLWGSAGDYMAVNSGDLIVVGEFSLYDNENGRDGFANAIGAGYGDLLKKLVAVKPERNLATTIAKISFDPDIAPGLQVYKVTGISEKPVKDFDGKELYLTYFGVVEEYGREPVANDTLRLLELNNWGSCVLKF